MRDVLADMVTDPERADAYRGQGRWDGTTLSGRLATMAATRSERLAVIDRDGRTEHSYAELAADSARFAAWLGARGVGVGDVVSIQLPNWYEFVVAALATQSVGAVINPLLPVYRRKELVHVFTVAEPKVVCTPATYREHDHLAHTRAAIAASGRSIVHVVVDDRRPPGAGAADAPTVWFADTLSSTPNGGGERAPAAPGPGERPDAVSELIFTSGTEAAPKAIMHTEQTANFSVRVARQDLGIGDGDVVWMPSPIGHSTGFNYGVRFAIYHGLPLVLQDRWDAAVACDLIAGRRASYTLASTTFLQDLVGEAERRGDVELSSMTRFGCGGAGSACSVSTVRPRCWSPPGTARAGPGTRPSRRTGPRSAASRSTCVTTRERPARRGRSARSTCGARTPASASTAIRIGPPPRSHPAGGSAPATSPHWTPTAISRWSAARRRSSSAAA
jgi:acyl-CoA synthetase (AMP-forming)/AMP-acid ligase II